MSNGLLRLQSYLRAWTITACLFILRHKEIKIYFKFTCLILLVFKICCQAVEIVSDFSTSFIEYFFLMKVCSSYHCAFPSVFQILLEEPPSVQSMFPSAAEAALWQAVRELKLADLYFKCQRCFTLAFQIPFAFFNPSLGPCLKQCRFREALVQPELYCYTAGVIVFYSYVIDCLLHCLWCWQACLDCALFIGSAKCLIQTGCQ